MMIDFKKITPNNDDWELLMSDSGRIGTDAT